MFLVTFFFLNIFAAENMRAEANTPLVSLCFAPSWLTGGSSNSHVWLPSLGDRGNCLYVCFLKARRVISQSAHQTSRRAHSKMQSDATEAGRRVEAGGGPHEAAATAKQTGNSDLRQIFKWLFGALLWCNFPQIMQAVNATCPGRLGFFLLLVLFIKHTHTHTHKENKTRCVTNVIISDPSVSLMWGQRSFPAQ